MNNIFLGKPPANIEAWIKSHQPTPAPAYTHAWTTDGVEHLFDVDKLEAVDVIGYVDDYYTQTITYFDEVIQLESGKWQIKQKMYGYDTYSDELDEEPVFAQIEQFIMKNVRDYDGNIIGDIEFHKTLLSIVACQPVDINGNVVEGFEITKLVSEDNSKLTSIGSAAFQYCNNLTSVSLGNSVTTIGDNAFYDCNSLTSVTIAHMTMDKVENMIVNDFILGTWFSSDFTITFTCKDGKVEARYDQDNWEWRIIQIPFNS